METVSAVIPTYDRDTLVSRAVESALSQTHDSNEVIVVDDHSPTPVGHLRDTDHQTASRCVNPSVTAWD